MRREGRQRKRIEDVKVDKENSGRGVTWQRRTTRDSSSARQAALEK